MKQLEVQIMGQSYLLGAPEGGEARLLEAVERVDTAMCRIRDAGKIKARDRIAVLAALNLAFDLSEAPAAPAAVPAPGPSGSTAGSRVGADSGSASATDGAGDERLTALMARLDAVLGDGQLL